MSEPEPELQPLAGDELFNKCVPRPVTVRVHACVRGFQRPATLLTVSGERSDIAWIA